MIAGRLPIISYDDLLKLKVAHTNFQIEDEPFKMRCAWNKGNVSVLVRKHIEMRPLKLQHSVMKIVNEKMLEYVGRIKKEINKKPKTIKREKEKRYLGVSVYNLKNASRPFSAYISSYSIHVKKQIHIGYFSDYHDAAIAYNERVSKINPNAKLNVIDRSMPTPKRYLDKIARIKIRLRTKINLSIPQSIQLIKSNTTDKNAADNKAIVMYLSGRKQAMGAVTTKYYWYWIATIRGMVQDYKTKNKIRRRITEFTFTDADVVSEATLRMLGAFARGKFDGRKFKQWSTQVVRNMFRQMVRNEIARRQEAPKKNTVQDFDYEAAWAAM